MLRIQQLEKELVHYKKTSASVSPSLPVTESVAIRPTSPAFSLGNKSKKDSTSKLRLSLENRASKY